MHHSPTLQFYAELHFDHQTVAHWSQFCCKAMSSFILVCPLQLFLNGGWQGMAKLGKHMIDASAGKCVVVASCARLHFCWCQVGISDTCLARVADRSAETLLPIIKACILPSTTIISDCWGHNVCLCNVGLTPLCQLLCEFLGMWMLTNTIYPTWMQVKVNLRSY